MNITECNCENGLSWWYFGGIYWQEKGLQKRKCSSLFFATWRKSTLRAYGGWVEGGGESGGNGWGERELFVKYPVTINHWSASLHSNFSNAFSHEWRNRMKIMALFSLHTNTTHWASCTVELQGFSYPPLSPHPLDNFSFPFISAPNILLYTWESN